MIDREALLERAKNAVSDTGLPAHVLDTLVTELHERIYWPEIEKLLGTRLIRKVKEVPAKHRVQINGRGTSLRAAIAQTPALSQWYYRSIYLVLTQTGPLTDEQIFAFLRSHDIAVTESSARTRRSELVDAGWVRPSGQTGTTAAGHPSIRWEAIQELS